VSRTAGRAALKRPGVEVRSDARLVRETLAGRTQAFDQLVRRYQRRATSVAWRLVGDLHDAMDICQEAFVRAYRNLGRLEDQRRFAPWLLRIVTNLSLNWRRDHAVERRRVSLGDPRLDQRRRAGQRLADRRHPDERPGARLAAEELHALARQAIAELPEPQRVALILFSLEEMPQKDVAEVLRGRVEAVKWYVFQARRRLRQRLADYL